MSRVLRRWFMRIGVIVVVACTDSIAPPSPAVQLAFTVQPSSTTAGVAFDPVVAVAIEDASGDVVTSATNVVTMTVGTNPGADTLKGAASVAAVHGVATFSNLRLDRAAAGYTLKAAATGLTGATSMQLTIAAASPTRLAFTVQPSNAMGGAVITPPVQVAAQDAYGNLVTGFQDSVTVVLGSNLAPGTLSGTTVVKAIDGVATFSDLSIAPVSLGYTLTASAGGLARASSVPFAIAKPTASLRISAATSGSLPDPDGYAVCIDSTSDNHGGITCAYDGPLAVGVNDSGTVTVDTGAHAVFLRGVAANCTVGGNPRAVHTVRGEIARVRFDITCATASLHITTTTTGVSLDPDGYSLCIDLDYWEGGCVISSAIGSSDRLTVAVGWSGSHYFDLSGIADNCTVSGDNPRTVVVDSATEVSFVITCVAAGAVHVTAATTGIDLDQTFGVCFDPSGTGCAKRYLVPANGGVSIPTVIAGPHTVSLSDVGGNCSVSGSTTRAVTVLQDATADVAFDVACVLAERIAFSSGGTIYVIRADGSDYYHKTTPGHAPAWSPNGARLAYECGEDICAINADSTGFARLTLDAAGNHHPTWSPDGSKIAFAATHAGATDLYVMAASGSGVVQLTQGVGFVGSPAWSPDGVMIVFDCQVDAGNDDICSVNADGTGFARLTSNPARDYGAAWKWDGSTLAFATTRYGGDEIALRNVASGGVTRIGAGLPGFAPTWSNEGTQLAFVRVYDCDWCSDSEEIFVATADGAGVHSLGPGEGPAWKPHP